MSLNRILCLLLTVVFFSTNSLCASSISNGDFELYEPNETLDFNVPLFWEIKEYAAVTENLIPNFTTTLNWKIDINTGLFPAQDNHFLVMTTGSDDINYAEASQQVTINEGDTLSGFYFFGTSDYLSWNDAGTIRLVPDSNTLEDINIVYVDVNMVGNYSSMEGWEQFEYTFDADQAGTYQLILSVIDVNDYKYISYFCVDGLAICNPSASSDLYNDCRVDFTDFALFSTDWLGDCSDPNYYMDPNSNCYLGTDLDENGPVDFNDLWLFSEDWLL